MTTTMVLISAAEKNAVKAAIERARANLQTRQQVLIPRGYHVAVQFEPRSAGLFLHLEITVKLPSEPSAVPSASAVRMIAGAFGIAFPIEGEVWEEESEPGHKAVNIAVLVEPSGDDVVRLRQVPP